MALPRKPVLAQQQEPYTLHNTPRSSVASVRSEPASPAHVVPRAPWLRHAGICLLVVLAMLVLMRWWAWAWAPASVIAILYLMYASLEMTERRSRALRESAMSGPRPDTHSALVARERIGARILATLVLGLFAIALIVAALVIDSQLLGIGTAMVFGAVVFVGLPAWAAAVGDSLPAQPTDWEGGPRQLGSGGAPDAAAGAMSSSTMAPTHRMK